MKIKKYRDFILESYDGFETLGEWVESHSEDDYILNIVNRYIDDSEKLYGGLDINPDINLANAINLLPHRTQVEIYDQIKDYLQSGIRQKKAQVLVSTETDELLESQEIPEKKSEIGVAGKGIFTSFLKSLTALGLKESVPNWQVCPDNFLFFYSFPSLDSQLVKMIFSRFKSLTLYINNIDYSSNEVGLYFGIDTLGNLEYGFQFEDRIPIGKFKLTKSSIKWLLSLESKSISSLKKEIVNLNPNDMVTLGLIKADMMTFTPGYFEKKSPAVIRDRIISFGFFGVGRWDNGKLDEGEYQNIKSNFTNWLLSKRWGNRVLINLKPESFWLHIHIKLK